MPFQPGNKHGNRFKPGESANPGGKPKHELNVLRLAQEHGLESTQCLIKIMRGELPGDRRQAANDILDRGFGKPKQSTELTLRDAVSELGDDDIAALIATARAANATTAASRTGDTAAGGPRLN